jgi:hypothetical protein
MSYVMNVDPESEAEIFTSQSSTQTIYLFITFIPMVPADPDETLLGAEEAI